MKSEVKEILQCRKCGFVWKNEKKLINTICPNCKSSKDARDRSKYSKKSGHKNIKKIQKWKKENPEKVKKSMDKWRKRLRQSVFFLVAKGNPIECVNCGCNNQNLLEINHIDGGGNKEIKLKGIMQFYMEIRNLKRDTTDLEIRCRVCNSLHYLELKYGKLPFKIIWKK